MVRHSHILLSVLTPLRYRVAGMLQTLCPDAFTAYVKEQERKRRDKIDSQRDLNVSIHLYDMAFCRSPLLPHSRQR